MNISAKKIEQLKSFETIDEFLHYAINSKTAKKLQDMIFEKLNDKITNPEADVYFLYDYHLFNSLVNGEKALLNKVEGHDELNELLKKLDYDGFLDGLSKLRNKYASEDAINEYCVSNICRIITIAYKGINLIGKEKCYKEEFLGACNLIEGSDELRATWLIYFTQDVKDRFLDKDEIDYIFTQAKRNNIPKYLFNPIGITTTKILVNKLKDIFIYLFENKNNSYINLNEIDYIFNIIVNILI